MRAITGRDELGAGDLIRMMRAEMVYNAKLTRDRSSQWAEWARDNPEAARLLAQIERDIENG